MDIFTFLPKQEATKKDKWFGYSAQALLYSAAIGIIASIIGHVQWLAIWMILPFSLSMVLLILHPTSLRVWLMYNDSTPAFEQYSRENYTVLRIACTILIPGEILVMCALRYFGIA